MKNYLSVLNKTTKKILLPALALILLTVISISVWMYHEHKTYKESTSNLTSELNQTKEELHQIKSQDQYVRNEELENEINNIKNTYGKTVSVYEQILDVKESGNTPEINNLFAQALAQLADANYTSAEASLTTLEKNIKEKEESIASTFSVPENTPINNTPPDSGFTRQQVSTEVGNFLADIVSADLSSTRVIVDTAAENDCTNDCPTLSLDTYVAQNGAYAAINGSYFCPASYPSCAGKTNSFDTLLMNKNKTYFNSENNTYSTVPAVIFGDGWVRFVGQTLEWGRDTSIDSMIANQPLLVSNGQSVFSGQTDPKEGVKAGRSFVASKGSTVYIGVVHNATVAESAKALETLGMEHALNLDSGGSTALWADGGYKVGPGRNIPNAILFVNK